MKITKRSIDNTNVTGITIGSTCDRDVIYCALGYQSNHPLVKAVIEFDTGSKLEMNFVIQGEQNRVEFNGTSSLTEDQLENLLNTINRKKLSKKEDIEEFAKLLDSGDVEFGNNSWLEGVITLRKGEKTLIKTEYESDLGLDGVWQSVQDINEFLNDDVRVIDLLNYLEDYEE